MMEFEEIMTELKKDKGYIVKVKKELFTELIKNYKKIIADKKNCKHCQVSADNKFYTSRTDIKNQVDRFFKEPSEDNFEAFWNRGNINSAVRKASNTYILEKYGDLVSLKNDVESLIKIEPLTATLAAVQQPISNSKNTSSELYYYYHMELDQFPLVNGCSTRSIEALKNAGILESTKSDPVAVLRELKDTYFKDADFENAKREFYLLDQLLNLLDKIVLTDVQNEKDSDIKVLYQYAYLLTFWQSRKTITGDEDEFDSLIKKSKNIIFYGAPGTGKTYSLKKNINRIIEDNPLPKTNSVDRFEIVQFHPSYSYEDFMEGPKPIIENGVVALKLKHGDFFNFCDEARRFESEFVNASEDKKMQYAFFFLADEINRAELSRVLGELLYCLEYRGEEITTQYSYMKPGEKFSIPKNVYFFGTMNDVDKSIDSFDLALRRRFLWHRKDCDYDVIKTVLEADGFNNIGDINDKNDKPINGFVMNCFNLNNYITEDNGIGLGKAYQIGHSYFLAINSYLKSNSEIKPRDMKALFDDRLAPLLKEYFRSTYPEKQLDVEVEKARTIFTNSK